MRATRQDWVEAGLILLRDEGEQALTLERLCERLKLTRGSFYHHFSTLQVYRAALLALWVSRSTEEPIAQAAQETRGAARLTRLGEVVRHLDHSLDLAMRVWSFRDAEVRAAVAQVDCRRLEYLTDLHRALGQAAPERLAREDYASLVGAQCLGWVETWHTDRQARLHVGASLQGQRADP